MAFMCVSTAAVQGLAWHDDFMRRELLSVTPPDIRSLFVDDAPVQVTVAAGGFRAVWTTTPDEIRSSPSLWRRMHLADWNNVEPTLRAAALDRMLAHYHEVLTDPARWDAMTVADWDDVPQPIRTVAYREMVAYWAGFYRLGPRNNLPPKVVSDMLAAIVMSESWLDHRASFVNSDGTVDMGLGMASEYARVRMRQLHELGAVDASFTDEEYLNPWLGTRFAAIWLSLLLDEAHHDLRLAVRAYNRGISEARDARGTAYLAAVERRLKRFIQNREAPPAWSYVWQRARDIERAEWPWVQRSVRRAGPEGP